MGRSGKAKKQKGVIETEMPKTTMAEATAYVKTVKKTFRGKDQLSNYLYFLDLLVELKTVDANTDAMTFQNFIKRINDLFRLHPQLIIGFNVFLPEKYRYDLDVATTSGTSDDNLQSLR